MQVDESTLQGNKYLLLVCEKILDGDKTYEEPDTIEIMETYRKFY